MINYDELTGEATTAEQRKRATEALSVLCEEFGYWSEAEGKFELDAYVDVEQAQRTAERLWAWCSSMDMLVRVLEDQVAEEAAETQRFRESLGWSRRLHLGYGA